MNKLTVKGSNDSLGKHFMSWVKAFLCFNNIEYPVLVSKLQQMLLIYVNYPKLFSTTNPIVQEFVTKAQSMGFETDNDSDYSWAF
jgi:hypothetical protein